MHTSTYRIQFNRSFPFQKMQHHADYLKMLGVDTLYASPVFVSTPGSVHGYDVTDPLHFNPELGGAEAFENLNDALREKQIGWLQDIVPNHMAFNRHNLWLWDVLDKGMDSAYADVFDIDWDHPDFKGKLMVPVLGKSFGEAVQDNELKLVCEEGKFFFRYFDNLFPVNSRGFLQVCRHEKKTWPEELRSAAGNNDAGWDKERTSNSVGTGLEEMVSKLYRTSTVLREWIVQRLEDFSSDASNIHLLHDMQFYRLCYWKLTEEKINYRRFFTVNGLICLRMEDPDVFERYHDLLKTLLNDGKFTGLRIDHIDGLLEPNRYLTMLRQIMDKNAYLVVEKILEQGEDLSSDWEVQGTTGYEFMALVNNLFTNEEKCPVLAEFYRDILPVKQDLSRITYDKKRFILFERMKGELENLFRGLYMSDLIPEINKGETDPGRFRLALAEFLLGFPVYRLYASSLPLDENNVFILRKNIEEAIVRKPALEKELRLLMEIFLKSYEGNEEMKKKVLSFLRRCMQFTGPLMAKGVEDTTMYYFHQLIAHNEVGDDPGARGLSVNGFHNAMKIRNQKWPFAMNATSTHDTKRGEDARARLNVISDVASDWVSNVKVWFRMNSEYKQDVNGKTVPTRNEEYLIYQTLAGIWPFEGGPDESYKERLQEYLIKAMREAKMHTTWNDPEEEHENRVIGFLMHLLEPGSAFYLSFDKFLERISGFGILNSLVQVILKMTCPGIPDVYQGSEMWNFSLVDPDNRRPVDYNLRKDRLNEMINTLSTKDMFGSMTDDLYSGDMKLWIVHTLLQSRKSDPDLYLKGEYIPAEVTGPQAGRFMAFFRRYGSRWLLVVIPLHLAAMNRDWRNFLMNQFQWAEAEVILPEWCTGPGFDILFKRKITFGDKLVLKRVFSFLPLMVLQSG